MFAGLPEVVSAHKAVGLIGGTLTRICPEICKCMISEYVHQRKAERTYLTKQAIECRCRVALYQPELDAYIHAD